MQDRRPAASTRNRRCAAQPPRDRAPTSLQRVEKIFGIAAKRRRFVRLFDG
jgi:hypothetical protein